MSIFKSYINSYKHSFKFNEEEQPDEYKSFDLFTVFACIISCCISYLWLKEWSAQLSLALFWCYMSVAMFPLMGIVNRRLNYCDFSIWHFCLKFFKYYFILTIIFASISAFSTHLPIKFAIFQAAFMIINAIKLIAFCLLNFPMQTAFVLFIFFNSWLSSKQIKTSSKINHKQKSELNTYIFIILFFFLLPLNYHNFYVGSFGTILEQIRSSKNIEQRIDIIADKQVNSLSIPLLQTLAEQHPNKNLLISAQNAYLGLGILANGAKGETLIKLKKLLGTDNLDLINQKSQEIVNKHTYALNFNNSVSITKKHLQKDYKKIIAKYYKPKFTSSQEACQISLSSNITFNAKWKQQFGDYPKSDTFYAPTGAVNVRMMEDKRKVYIAKGTNFRVLALPYRTGDIFYIILPDSTWNDISEESDIFNKKTKTTEQIVSEVTTELTDVLKTLTPESLNLKFEEHEIDIQIPTFEFSENINLTEILNTLGLGNLFERGSAELENILSSNAGNSQDCYPSNIHISDFKQNNGIIVNEKGTKVYSFQVLTLNYATGEEINAPFIVNRPFIFMINNGAYVGIVNNPLEHTIDN